MYNFEVVFGEEFSLLDLLLIQFLSGYEASEVLMIGIDNNRVFYPYKVMFLFLKGFNNCYKFFI